MSNEPSKAAVLRIIRLALFTGVILFGCVAWYINRSETAPAASAGLANGLALAYTAIALVGLVGIVVIRSLQAKATGIEKRGTLAIAGWALGEGPALFGGVIYLLYQTPIAYLTGVALLLVSFALVPVPEDA